MMPCLASKCHLWRAVGLSGIWLNPNSWAGTGKSTLSGFAKKEKRNAMAAYLTIILTI